MKNFNNIGLQVPTILLPKEGIDMQKWTVIACDQYTSQPEYWEDVKDFTSTTPSSLKVTFPEVYLEDDDVDDRIKDINSTMKEYVDSGVLAEMEPGFILVDRKTSHAESRKGLIIALDLDQYDFTKGSSSLIRSTEGTIVDRLPPRIKVRENAEIELPHIMVLIDDPDMTVIEPLFKICQESVYDFELMKNGGHLKGFKVTDEAAIDQVAINLEKLAEKGTFEKKYNAKGQAVLLYAMGDGNHSFATAKAIWEKKKDEAVDKEVIMKDPARYALVELVNIHDEGLQFEAIHRVVFDVEVDDMLAKMKIFYEANGSKFSFMALDNKADASSLDQNSKPAPFKMENAHVIPFITVKWRGNLIIQNPKLTLEVATLQSFLDEYMADNLKVKVDYIHGDDVVTELGSKVDNIGFYLPAISKHDLFKTIIFDGALPRKTFSMGEADEKRFYLECRKIK